MSAEIKKKVMASARNSCIEDLSTQLKMINLQWFECCYPNGDTPLHAAAKEGKVDVVKHLLENLTSEKNYADVSNRSGKTPLHEACQNAHPETVEYLISKGANCRAIKQADWTPLMLACTRKGLKALQCCQMLIDKGGLLLLKDKNKDGWNAFHIAAREGDITIVKALLQKDLSQAMVKSKNGRTPLHTAALHGWSHITKLLLSSEAVECNARDSCGSTPMHDAVRSGDIETVMTLKKAGANVETVNNEGYGILHMAAEVGQHKMLKFLCEEFHVCRNSVTNSGSTPLHCAVRSGQIKAAETLLQYGANPLAKDVWGRSCHDLIPEKISEEDCNKLNQILLQPYENKIYMVTTIH